MNMISKLIAAHPIQKRPYHSIRFSRCDGNGVPLYTVNGMDGECGAMEALKRSFAKNGGHCFHCDNWLPPQSLSLDITRDHIRPRALGGSEYLHNLVLACGPCNRNKGEKNLADFSVEKSKEYARALDEHLTRCLAELAKADKI
jgi:5-methylcytosine-specific restriction endonuclease McrA